MPETPDFEKLARDISDLNYEWDFEGDALASAIVTSLVIVWNARGAADIATIEHELSSMLGASAAGPYVKNLDRAIHGLDQVDARHS